MPDPIDLTGPIAASVNGAAVRGHTLVIGYVDEHGYPALSFRGSAQVHNPQQLAIWARNPTEGIVKSIAERSKVSLLFFEVDGPGPRYLSFQGRAHVDASANDAVYENMVELEQQRDADRKGVAVIIDVESVRGFGADGPFEQNATSAALS